MRTNENFGLFIIDDQKFNNSQLSLRVEQHVFLLVLFSLSRLLAHFTGYNFSPNEPQKRFGTLRHNLSEIMNFSFYHV